MDRGGLGRFPGALAAVAVAGLVACSGGGAKLSPAFCATVRAIQHDNTNAPAMPAQQQYQQALTQAEQLAGVSPPAVRSALGVIAQSLQPLAAGEAVATTPSMAAAAAKRHSAAVATIDKALRSDCGVDISALGTTQSATVSGG